MFFVGGVFLENIIERLVKKYKTSNPYELCSSMNIIVIKEELGTLNGYCHTFQRNKFIHINSSLSYDAQKFTCAHELGHHVLHKGCNIFFLKSKTLLKTNKYEEEANEFARILLNN